MKLDCPIRNEIMNFEQRVRSIQHMSEGEISLTLHSKTSSLCPCSDSEYSDPHHGYVVTGDLRIIENAKLHRLSSKGPKYHENKTIDYNTCLKDISSVLDI